MLDVMKSLKVLERIRSGDVIALEVRGVPCDVLHPRVTLHFVPFFFTQSFDIETSAPIVLTGMVQDGIGDRRCVEISFMSDYPPGMYLLSGLVFRALLQDGRYAIGAVGNAAVPMRPFLGFCVGWDLCDVKLLEDHFQFLHLTIP
jgi:hypothetical protein